MRICVVHPYPVHSAAVGGTTRVYGLVRHLAARHRVSVATHASGDPEADEAAVADLAELGVEQRMFRRPRPSLARRVGWLLAPDPYFVSRNLNPSLSDALERMSGDVGGVDVIHTEFAYLHPLLPRGAGRPALVLAEQETMSVAVERLRRIPARDKNLYERYLERRGPRVERFERRVLPRYDRVFAISEREAERMSRLAGREVPVVPHVVSTSRFVPGEGDGDGSVLFVGNYAHRPNLHGLLWMVEEVWPRVRAAVPDASLRVVGPGLDEASVRRLESEPGVEAVGWVEDIVRAYQRCGLFVNPLHSGSGMRGKVLEAFACARPVVSTAVGMEGIAAVDGCHARVADSPEEFGSAVVAYLRNPDLGRRHGAAARSLVCERYDVEVVLDRLEGELETLVERRAFAAGGRA